MAILMTTMAESFMKAMKVEAVYPMAYETFEDVVEGLRAAVALAQA